jgi:peptidoglycan/xylan/chitin deacetylase (PgdA/CDA1 family)
MTSTAPAFLPVLTFHDISDTPSPWCLPPDVFRRLIQWLTAEGYTTHTMTELALHYAGQQPITGRAVALTFDDGRDGIARHARGVLAEHGIRATVYPVAGWARGTPLPAHEAYSAAMTLAQLRQMHADGHEIGYHTSNHRCLRSQPNPAVHRQLTTARCRFQDDLGAPIRHFSYPYGHYDHRIDTLVDQHGQFATVVTNARDLRPDPRHHPRISIKRNLRDEQFPVLFDPASWRSHAPVVCDHQPPTPPPSASAPAADPVTG